MSASTLHFETLEDLYQWAKERGITQCNLRTITEDDDSYLYIAHDNSHVGDIVLM